MAQPLPLKFSGKIIHGAGRGRTLGFPTANLDTQLPDDLPLGIYAGWVVVLTDTNPPSTEKHLTNCHPALIYWGTRPTFGEKLPIVEIYLLDKSKNLYNATLDVELVAQLRTDQVFSSSNDLIRQMSQDVKDARRRLKQPTSAKID